MDGDDHGSNNRLLCTLGSTPWKKRKRTTLILTILLSRGHSWIFHRWQMTTHVPLSISFLGEDCLHRCSCLRCTAAYDPLPTICYCRMLQKSNRAKMLWVLVVRSNWPPKVYTGTGHVQYYHALPIFQREFKIVFPQTATISLRAVSLNSSIFKQKIKKKHAVISQSNFSTCSVFFFHVLVESNKWHGSTCIFD